MSDLDWQVMKNALFRITWEPETKEEAKLILYAVQAFVYSVTDEEGSRKFEDCVAVFLTKLDRLSADSFRWSTNLDQDASSFMESENSGRKNVDKLHKKS